MKRTLLFLFCALMSAQMFADPEKPFTDYYWYQDSIIYLDRGDQEYIIYNDSLLLESDKEKLAYCEVLSYPEMANLKWGITQPNAVLEDVEHVFYRMPSYKDGEGSNMFVTHRFYVRLKNSNDLSLLQSMAKQYNAEIEKESALPLWYILRCGLQSSFNALNLANLFHDSGQFSVAEPEFIGGIYPTSIEQVTNNQSERTQKMLHNGMLIIESDGKTYNVMGVEVGK